MRVLLSFMIYLGSILNLFSKKPSMSFAKSKKVLKVYSTKYCPFGEMVMISLKVMNLEFKTIDVRLLNLKIGIYFNYGSFL